MPDSVEAKIKEAIKERGALHMTLLDPQKIGSERSAEIASEAEKGGNLRDHGGGVDPRLKE